LHRLSIASIFASIIAVTASHAERGPGRIAIIDASINTRPYLDAFAEAGIKVLGRYFSRCPQPEIVPEKRLIDNAGEIQAVLAHKSGFGVLSIYQYFNNHPLKFSGKRKISCKTKKGETLTVEVTLPGADCTPRPLDDCKEAEGQPHSGADEAELDARAAVAQAKLVGQPSDTAIYFGIDFELGAEGKEQAVQYFTIVSNELKDNGYLVGVYGSGATLAWLKRERHKTGRHAGQPLVDFTWLDASRGHAGAADFYNRGEWDLFQSRTDLHLPVSVSGSAEIDTDIQNPARAGDYVGFWDARGQYRVPQVRTKAVYDQRRFACSGRSPVREAPAPEVKPVGSLGLGSVVRIGDERGGFVQVDRDEDGTYDGWVLVTDLSPTFAKRPHYVPHTKEHGTAACLPSGPPGTTAAVR
jgi:glycoside hydrolase-like protein